MSDHEIPEEIARRLRPLGEAPAPDTSPALAAFLASPVVPLTDKGDLPATAASNVNGPVTAPAGQAARLPKRRHDMKQLLGDALGALARLGLVGKVALGAGAIAVAGMGSAAAVNAVVADVPATPAVQAVSEEADDVTEPATTEDADDQGQDEGQDATSMPSADEVAAQCDAATTHGEFVSWVARSFPTGPGHGLAVREAAQSDCGKTDPGTPVASDDDTDSSPGDCQAVGMSDDDADEPGDDQGGDEQGDCGGDDHGSYDEHGASGEDHGQASDDHGDEHSQSHGPSGDDSDDD